MNKATSVPPVRLLIDNMSAAYGARLVLANVSLDLRSGDVLVISGANGSGKSTLLRVLCGLQAPSSGVVAYEVGGTRYGPREASALVGWVAPDLQLYRELTALENLRFFASVRGLRRSDDELVDVLDDVGLTGREHDRMVSYSTGMQQRMRYAFALLHEPPVLLLDEPTVTLDERGAAIVEALIAQQRRRGITIVATNDPRELRWGDYVLTLGA